MNDDAESVITVSRIAQGLGTLVLQIANDVPPPDGWAPHEWMYVKGIASAAIFAAKREIIGRATS